MCGVENGGRGCYLCAFGFGKLSKNYMVLFGKQSFFLMTDGHRGMRGRGMCGAQQCHNLLLLLLGCYSDVVLEPGYCGHDRPWSVVQALGKLTPSPHCPFKGLFWLPRMV